MNHLSDILRIARKQRDYSSFVMTQEQWKSFHDRPILLMKDRSVEKSSLAEIAQKALQYARSLGYDNPEIEDGIFHMLEYLESIYGRDSVNSAAPVAFHALTMYRDLCGADVAYLAVQYGFQKLDLFIGALIEILMGMGQEGILSQYLKTLDIAPSSEVIELPDTVFAAKAVHKYQLVSQDDQNAMAHIHAMARLSGKCSEVESALESSQSVATFAAQIAALNFGKFTRIHYIYLVQKYTGAPPGQGSAPSMGETLQTKNSMHTPVSSTPQSDIETQNVVVTDSSLHTDNSAETEHAIPQNASDTQMPNPLSQLIGLPPLNLEGIDDQNQYHV